MIKLTRRIQNPDIPRARRGGAGQGTAGPGIVLLRAHFLHASEDTVGSQTENLEFQMLAPSKTWINP